MRSHPGSAASWPPAPGSPGLRRLPAASVDTVPDRVKERKRGRARKCLVQKAALTPTRTSSLRWKRLPCGFQEAGHSSLNPGVELPSADEAGAPRISLLKIRHKAPLSTVGLQSPGQPVLRSKLLAEQNLSNKPGLRSNSTSSVRSPWTGTNLPVPCTPTLHTGRCYVLDSLWRGTGRRLSVRVGPRLFSSLSFRFPVCKMGGTSATHLPRRL